MRSLPTLIAATLAAASTPAMASLEEAKALLDAAAPQHCEVLTLQLNARALPAGSPQREEASAAAARRAADVERALAPQMARFESARASLAGAQRDELQSHARRLLDECATRAYAAHGAQPPLEPARGARPVAAEAKTSGSRQKSLAAPEAAALQKQPPAAP